MVHGIANSAEHVRASQADVVSNRSNGNDDSAGDDERRDDRDAVAWSAFLACERGISPIGEYKGRTTKRPKREDASEIMNIASRDQRYAVLYPGRSS